MKIKIIIIAAMLAVSGLTRAQVSKDAFEKAVDFVNCKTVELSIKNDANNYQQYIQTCPCGNEVTYNQVKKFLTSVGTYDKTILLSGEIESLKNTFKDGMKNEDALKFLSETIFTDKVKYQKLVSFADKRKADKDFAAYKDGLKKELPTILATQTQTSNTSQPNADSQDQVKPPTLEERVATLEQRPEPKVEDKVWFDGFTKYLAILATILSIVAIILSLKKRTNKEAINSDEIYDSIINKILASRRFGDHIQGELNKKISQRDIIDSVINKLRPEFTKIIEEKSENKPTAVWNNPSQDFTHKEESKQPEVKTETFFLSTPNADGSFNDSSVSPTYKEGASIYKFTKVGNNRANFQIDEREASVKLALTYPDKSIDPVCDAVNAFNPKANRITTVNVGEAELLNDRWIVNKTQKAKIRYES